MPDSNAAATVAESVEPASLSTPRLFYGWWIVFAGAGIQLLTGALFGQAYGAYVVVLREQFGWSKTLLSGASSMREAESGITGPFQGWLLERFGPRLVIQAGIVIFGAGFMLFSQVNSAWTFFLAFFVMSVGASLCGYLSITFTIVQWFERRRATAISLTAAGFAIGGIVVRLTVLFLEAYGWRWTAFLSGVVILAVGLPLSQLFQWRPADRGLQVDGVFDGPGLRPGAALLRSAETDYTLGEAMRTRAFWFLGLGHASALFVVAAMNVHLVSHLKEGLGYSLGFASTIAIVMPILFLVGTVTGGPLGDRFSKRWLVVLCMFMHASGLLLLSHASNLGMVLAFATLHGLAWGWRGPQMAAIRADYFGRSSFGKILGVSNLIIILGTISGPLIAGLVYDHTGSYRVGFDIVASIAAAGSLFFILAPRPGPPRRLAA
jgi:MFS family permease